MSVMAIEVNKENLEINTSDIALLTESEAANRQIIQSKPYWKGYLRM